MLALELLCLVIVGIHITVAATRSPSPTLFLRRVAMVTLASWIAEDTCLHLYSFYAYHPDWVPYIDRMPLMVALIWPGVVMSSLELAQRLLGPLRQRLVPAVAGLMVLADASFMEPLAVKAGLWRWFEPGFFGVPPIGVCGWAFFSAAAMAVFCRTDRTSRKWTADLWVLLVAPAATHVLLLVSWWGLFRWINFPLPGWGVAGVAWAISIGLTLLAVARRANLLVPLGAMSTRIPAAIFFFGLLLIHGRDDLALFAYALAFAPPYLALTRWSDFKIRRRQFR